MKPIPFLRAVRLDTAATHASADERSAADGEWAVSGAYRVCDLAGGRHFVPDCRCDASFCGLESHRPVAIAEVAEIDEAGYEGLLAAFARHLLDDLGAPGEDVAKRVAREEFDHTRGVAAGFASGAWITVKRDPAADGEGFEERYALFQRLMIGAHDV